MGLKGLWLGFVLALALNAGLNTWFVSRINWKKQARKAQHQNRATEAFMQARRQEEADRLLGGSE
jgi:cytochrome oxidase assembly protein ShyY1